ncbi:MAG: hypothetical protein EOM03_09580 [Clostridia bacterium]|nr:hypothetical protein [Clostridia bacterium]
MSADAITTFTFPVTNSPVRVINRDGKPWFVATEVALILGYRNPYDAIRQHCKHPEILKPRDSRGLTVSPRGINVIPEGDVYRLITKSTLESAQKFEEWMMDVIMPSVRKDGGYIAGEEKMLTGEMSEDELLLKAMTILTKKVERLTAERDALQAENQTMLPKAKLYDQYMDVDGTLNLTSAAKVLGFTSGRALGMYLRETLGWLFLDTKQVIPKAHAIEKGYMTTKAWSMIDRQKSGVQGRITAKGMD